MSVPPFTPEQWSRNKQLFLRALELPPDERSAFLQGHAGDLRSEIQSLLEAESAAPAFMDSPGVIFGSMLTGHAPAATASGAPGPGRVVGSCQLVKLLGEGASGLVYLAEQMRPRRCVAVKVLRPGQASPAALRRFEREVEIMAGLRHPGIAQVMESGVDPAGAFLVMEYVEGKPVTEYAAGAELSINDRLQLFLRVCDAVQHAHAMGVMHRDLKPANILVTTAGQPKILDFGLARVIDAGARHATLTTSVGQVVGTLAYMSPEEAAGGGGGGGGGVDIRADVYAMGVILHELLAGSPPLSMVGKGLPEALRSIQEDAPRRLGTISRGCRGDLETIVAKALEKSPARRYASMSELAGDVRRHLERLPIQARPPSALYEIRRFTQRRRSLVASVAIAMTAVFASLGWSLASRARAHHDFVIARSVAGSWLADVMKALGTTPGTFEARRHMIQELRSPLQRFAERHPADLDAQANLAALSFAQGDLESETGNFHTAMGRYSNAFDIFTRITSQRPLKVAWQLRRSIAAVRVGDILWAWDQRDDAIARYLVALEIDRAAAREFPYNYTAQDQLVWSYDRLTNTAISMGKIAEAREYCDLLDAEAHRIRARWPDEPKALWCVTGSLHTRAHLCDRSDAPEQAFAARIEAIDLGRELVKLDFNRGYATGLAFALLGRANHELLAGNFDAVEALLTESEPYMRQAVSLDGHERRSHELGVGWYRCLWNLHSARGEHDDARAAVAAAARHARRMAELDPSTLETVLYSHQIELSYVELLAERGEHEEAHEGALSLQGAARVTSERFADSDAPKQILASIDGLIARLGLSHISR